MKEWPLPNSTTKQLPIRGTKGGFWENRGDRFHCGVDIYTPKGSVVFAIDSGIVVECSDFTTTEMYEYWNHTLYVAIQSYEGVIYKYAELEIIFVKQGDLIDQKQAIGKIGIVLNEAKIADLSPEYIQELNREGNRSMLHLEIYKPPYLKPDKYIGGNTFYDDIPEHMLDPEEYLADLQKPEDEDE